MNKAFKFRLCPDTIQRELLAKTFGCARFIYNRMLTDKKEHYERTNQNIRVTPAQYKAEFPWLCEVDSLALANAQLHLESAYRNFFRDNNAGYPKYKSKHSGLSSYTTNLVNGNITLAEGCLKLPKLGNVRIRQHRQIPEGYKLKSVTVSLVPSGKYYASILYEYEAEAAAIEPETIIGLDYYSRAANKFIHTINPTANNSANYLKKLPFYVPTDNELQTINRLVETILETQCIDYHQHEIDSFFENRL